MAAPHAKATTTTGVDLVPETLLALAKDERYVSQCEALLRQIMDWFGWDDAVAPGVAWLLYSLLVVRRSGRTLGMASCGLRPKGGVLWLSMALTACTSIAIQRTQQQQQQQRQTPLQQHESLRGRARRRYHERQRRAMMQQRTTTTTTTTTIDEQTTQQEPTTTTTQATNATTTTLSLSQRLFSSTSWERLKAFLWRVAVDLSVTSAAQQGPHGLPPSQATTNQAISAGVWLIRLHLAYFCWSEGKTRFPHWIHRLFGVTIARDHYPTNNNNSSSSNLLAQRPDTYRLVGLLLAIQAATELTKHGVHLFNQQWVAHTTATRRRPASSIHLFPSTRVACATTTRTTCTICGLPRTEPAAPISCGHVFCWKCLYQWTKTTRPECPLCRSPCRPQDILALHHYDPL